MFSRFLTASVAAAAMALSAPVAALAAPASAPDPLTFEGYVSCAAIFYLMSENEADAELKGALEAAVGVMLTRATPLGASRGMNQDAVLDFAANEAAQLSDAAGQGSAGERGARINRHGPGLEACFEEVLTER